MTAAVHLPDNLPENLVVFAHGKESGPWGVKITHLAAVARRRGYEVISPDYSQTPDPDRRVDQLFGTLAAHPRPRGALVLAGSSMGGYVSAMAVARWPAVAPTQTAPDALFLIAPAFYFPGYDAEPGACAITSVVHGWADDIVPAERALRYAATHRARLLMLDGGHTLNERLAELETAFDALLVAALQHAVYRQARYEVEIAGRPGFRIGVADAEADAALAAAGAGEDWAIVTACNPLGLPLGAADNATRMAALDARLAAAGQRWLPALGCDPDGRWPGEASRLLIAPPAGLAGQIAREFGQNAIVRGGPGRAPELVWLRN